MIVFESPDPCRGFFICTLASLLKTPTIKKILLILLFACGNVSAQKIIELGIHAGVNGSILSTSIPDYNTYLSPGARAGVFTRFNFGLLSITPEVNFSMVGSNGDFSNVSDRFYEAKNMTLEIPVVFGLRLVKGKLVNFYTRFGGFFAYNFYKSIHVHDPVFPQNDSLITPGRAANFNGGIVLGLGLDIWRFNLEMRYQWGFANLYGNNIVYQDPRAGFRYSAFSVTLGFYIYRKVLK